MRLTVLGSGTCIPKIDRASPGFVLEIEDSLVLVDPSSGSLHRMTVSGMEPSRVTHVVVSHFHPDHTGDLVPLFFAMKNPAYFPLETLTLIGPAGLRDLYRELKRLYGSWVRLEEGRLQVCETGDETRTLNGWMLESFSVEHTANSLGFRFSESGGRVLAYSGDTGYCPNLIRLLEKADCALVECSHPTSREASGHLTPMLAGRAARLAGVLRLILTHLYPTCDGHDLVAEVRQSGFEMDVEVARDGMRIVV